MDGKSENIIRKNISLIIILTMMSMIGLISSDIYLPSMPHIANYFHISPTKVQNTITTYLIGLAIFQLIYGPLSDVLGKKKTLVTGLVIYIISSIICMISPNIIVLLIARFFQAIGACSGLVMGRSIIADQFDKRQSAQVYSTILPIVAMSPAIAPIIGGYLQEFIGWRAVFGFSVIFGILLLYLVILQIDKSLKPTSQSNFHPMAIFYNNLALFKSKKFMLYTLIVGIVYCSWFSYLTASSYIFKSFGLTASLIGYCYISQSIASVVGSISSKKLLKFVPVKTMVLFALFISLFGALFMYFYGSELSYFLIGITIMAFANGILLPLNISQAMNAAVEYNSKIAGSASGLVGFAQIGSGAVGAFIMSLVPVSVNTLSWALIICLIIGIVLYLIKTIYD